MRVCFAFMAMAAWLAMGSAQAQLVPTSSQPVSEQGAAEAGEVLIAPPAPVSDSAQRLYQSARGKLLQVRTLLNEQGVQSGVGSGFLVSTQGHILTNYHVVSQAALEPNRYRLSYSMAQGGSDAQGLLELLAFDVVHDLALLRIVQPPKDLAERGALSFRPTEQPLAKGERIYSLGNPLDVGFAVVEGNYNGLVERSYDPRFIFSGSLNPGMSGGPALDERGRVMGVNVSTRRDGEQVSFLVPAQYAQRLYEAGKDNPALKGDAWAEITRQLTAYQTTLTQRVLTQPWNSAGHARYQIPVPQEQFLRCWGSGSAAETKGLIFERSQCQMDNALFVSNSLYTGNFSVRHEVYDARQIGALRFARVYSDRFANENFGQSEKDITAPQCRESFVDAAGLPLKAVFCLRAYKRLAGLYIASVLVTSVDAKTEGVQGRFDVHGVSFANALALGEHYLRGFGWKPLR